MADQTRSEYEALLKRLEGRISDTTKKEVSRLEVPTPQIIWVGQRTNISGTLWNFPNP